ncbi:MAG: hypothetical protein HC860_18680 [Alkalinema sp. RU_4_3]|nr:hypothetical protein [Alkalinema sp. RU_4_3]
MTDPKNLQVIERRQRAVELRKSGMTLEQVADQIAADPRFGVPNYGASSAYDDVRRALDQLNSECSLTTAQYRQLELERLDHMQWALQPKIDVGNTRAIEAAIKINDRRSKLLGLEAPLLLKVEQEMNAHIAEFVDFVRMHMTSAEYDRLLDIVEMMPANYTVPAIAENRERRLETEYG